MHAEPYTVDELKQLKCARCCKQAIQQWKICADDSWRPICKECDILLNGLVLNFMNDLEINEKMTKYQEKLRLQEILGENE